MQISMGREKLALLSRLNFALDKEMSAYGVRDKMTCSA
jgi:hypothetical protein